MVSFVSRALGSCREADSLLAGSLSRRPVPAPPRSSPCTQLLLFWARFFGCSSVCWTQLDITLTFPHRGQNQRKTWNWGKIEWKNESGRWWKEEESALIKMSTVKCICVMSSLLVTSMSNTPMFLKHKPLVFTGFSWRSRSLPSALEQGLWGRLFEFRLSIGWSGSTVCTLTI